MLCGIASQVRQYVNRTNYAHIKCAILSVLGSIEQKNKLRHIIYTYTKCFNMIEDLENCKFFILE